MSQPDLIAGLKTHLESYRIALRNLDKQIELIQEKAAKETEEIKTQRQVIINELTNFKSEFLDITSSIVVGQKVSFKRSKGKPNPLVVTAKKVLQENTRKMHIKDIAKMGNLSMEVGELSRLNSRLYHYTKNNNDIIARGKGFYELVMD